MTAVVTSLFHSNIAQTVYDEAQTRGAIYSYFIGKTVEWPDETDAPLPKAYQNYEKDVRNNIIQTKQVQLNDLSLVIPRIMWENNTVYDMFDDIISSDNPSSSGATSLGNANFYVINSEFNVYKCIFNNNGQPSTIQPSGTSSYNIETPDGYVWKFMSFIPLGLRNKFMTSEFMPITKSVKSQYYSKGTISGYNIIDGGQDYDPDETYLVIQGDGAGPASQQLSDIITYNVKVDDGTSILGFGKKFYINNVVAPSLDLIEGNTYRFEQSDPSNENYEIKFSLSGDGNHNPSVPGVEYTTNVIKAGIPGQLGAYTEITIPEGVATLNYYNEVTSEMGNRLFTKTSAGLNGQADIDLIIEGGEVVGLTINDGGYGYTNASGQVVTGALDSGSGALIDFILSEGDLDTQQANTELLAVDGSLSYIVIENSGISYTNATISITGDGAGARAQAIINANGQISSILMLDYGSGYSYANVTITGDGTDAQLRAIISPKGGHGSNAPEELCADTICFFTSFENEAVQDFNINNDYRQIGIIKNLAKAGTLYNKSYTTIGSACFSLEGTFNASDFSNDEDISTEGNSKIFKIVALEDNRMLVQSLFGHIPAVGDTIENSAMDASFQVSSVGNPTINKFSGNMLYIDNKLAFTPSDQQFVTFKTFIRF
jgi:hypothetical protein